MAKETQQTRQMFKCPYKSCKKLIWAIEALWQTWKPAGKGGHGLQFPSSICFSHQPRSSHFLIILIITSSHLLIILIITRTDIWQLGWGGSGHILSTFASCHAFSDGRNILQANLDLVMSLDLISSLADLGGRGGGGGDVVDMPPLPS